MNVSVQTFFLDPHILYGGLVAIAFAILAVSYMKWKDRKL